MSWCCSEQGLIPDAAAARLVDVLVEADTVPAESFGYDPAYGELYNCRERRFAEQIGDDAGWLHVARTRREAVRVAVRLRLRHDVLDLVEAAAGFCAATSEAASRHATTYLADQTYLQHAQPSTFGHYLLSFVPPVERDLHRLLAEIDVLSGSPAGVGSTNGGRLGYDRTRAAQLLGFDRVLEHTRDAMWQTDGLVAAVSAATSLVVTLSKLAEDLEIWASDEFAWVELSDGHARSSVMMPQKRNPYALGMVRAHAGVLIGRLTGLLATSRTPSARSDGLIVAYGEVPRALVRATAATRLMAGVVDGVQADARSHGPGARRVVHAGHRHRRARDEHAGPRLPQRLPGGRPRRARHRGRTAAPAATSRRPPRRGRRRGARRAARHRSRGARGRGRSRSPSSPPAPASAVPPRTRCAAWPTGSAALPPSSSPPPMTSGGRLASAEDELVRIARSTPGTDPTASADGVPAHPAHDEHRRN